MSSPFGGSGQNFWVLPQLFLIPALVENWGFNCKYQKSVIATTPALTIHKKVLVFQVNTCLEAAADFVMAVFTESCLALCWLGWFFFPPRVLWRKSRILKLPCFEADIHSIMFYIKQQTNAQPLVSVDQEFSVQFRAFPLCRLRAFVLPCRFLPPHLRAFSKHLWGIICGKQDC